MRSTKIMEAQLQALEDRDGEDSNNVDEDTKLGDDESELDRKGAQTTSNPT